ncbi:hypothetical protein HMPREF1609_00010 [Escherichia coli 908541]|nr:hypothetical protein HMPREF1609_00010 [Escherichia coli 908541]
MLLFYVLLSCAGLSFRYGTIHSVLIRSYWRCSLVGCRKVLPRRLMM